jgi:hypothetical protein
MVAGRRLWGRNKQRPAQHQPCCCGDLSVEAVGEDRLGAGEARGLGTDVEPGWQVDQEAHGKAQRPEREDDPAHSAAALVAQRRKGKSRG